MFWSLALSSQACILATSVWWFKQCTPVEYGWDRNIPGGSCASVSVLANLGYFTSAYSAFLDIVFALYPIPFIMRLNMPLKSRIAVSIALGLSSLACIVSIYKLAIFGDIFAILAEDPTCELPASWNLYPSAFDTATDPVPYLDILGVAEGAILIICASLPTLGPLFRQARDRYGNSSGSRGIANSSPAGHVIPDNEVDGNWPEFKGNRFENAEQGKASLASSTDDIALVSFSKQGYL